MKTKAQYDSQPQPIEYIGQGTWYINENITELTDGERHYWECDQTTVYEDPTPKTAPTVQEIAVQLVALMQTEVGGLADEQAQNLPALFPTWESKIGHSVATGDRLYYNLKLWRVVQAHTCQADWTPELTPALFVQVHVEEWPEWVQPTGAHDAYNTGDKVSYDGNHYTSLIDGNVWSPVAYPQGWRMEDGE